MHNARLVFVGLAITGLAVTSGHAQTPVPSDTGLSARVRCHIAALTAAKDPQVSCMMECIRKRHGVNIGGGCWHVCYAYRHPLPDQSIFKSCPPDPGLEPGPVPQVRCEPISGPSFVRGQVWDDSTGRPLRNAIVFLGAPRARGDTTAEFRDFARSTRVTTDSAGLFEFKGVSPGSFRLRVRGWGHLQSTVDTLVVEPQRSCTVIARLRTYLNEGF